MDETGHALYLIDVFGNKELLYRNPEISYFTLIPLRLRPRPPIITDVTESSTMVLIDLGMAYLLFRRHLETP